MDSVMPCSVAYVALQACDQSIANFLTDIRLQLCWCICSQDDWCIKDGAFNCKRFYRTVVKLFGMPMGDNEEEDEADKDEWVKETLHWWNE
jgi:hypothetical protein